MATNAYRTSWEFREIEGAQRWSATLYGRALPLRESNPQFGVQLKAEDTFPRGQREGRTEPMSVGYPDLVLSGHWKAAFFQLGDARVACKPSSTGRGGRTPHEACEWFEAFAARQKVVQVTWSGGAVRICRWDSFTWEPSIGPDRKWKATLKVLGRGGEKPFTVPSPASGADAIASLRTASRSLDEALAAMPDCMAPGFADAIKNAASGVREWMAKSRQLLHSIGDLARAPADAWRELNTMVESARDTCLEMRDTIEMTAVEYQVQLARSEQLLSAQSWRGQALQAVDANLDALFALILQAEAKLSKAARYAAVQPGQSLARIAIEQYGAESASRWKDIADANGIVGQTVPTGVSQLLIPE